LRTNEHAQFHRTARASPLPRATRCAGQFSGRPIDHERLKLDPTRRRRASAVGLQGADDGEHDISGRFIPGTAVDQVAATLARWYGVPSSDLPLILPNIGNFDSGDLGFMLG